MLSIRLSSFLSRRSHLGDVMRVTDMNQEILHAKETSVCVAEEAVSYCGSSLTGDDGVATHDFACLGDVLTLFLRKMVSG